MEAGRVPGGILILRVISEGGSGGGIVRSAMTEAEGSVERELRHLFNDQNGLCCLCEYQTTELEGVKVK